MGIFVYGNRGYSQFIVHCLIPLDTCLKQCLWLKLNCQSLKTSSRLKDLK